MSTEAAPFQLAIIEASRQWRFDPLRDFDPKKLTQALDAFRCGRLRDLSLVIDAQEERDDTLAAVVPKAKSAVARHGWDVLTVETDNNADAKFADEQKQALRHFYNQLRVTSALDQDEEGGVSLLLRQMMDAKSKRYAVHHIQWMPGAKPTARLWFVPLWFFENSTGKMRFIETAFGYDGVPMERDEWLVTKGLGIGLACAVAWTFKHMSLRDWVLYNARAGIPGIEGITDAPAGSEQWNNMVRAVAQAASQFRWVRNRTDEIKPIEFGAKGELPFAPLVERMDRAMAALWRGADLSTISAGAGQGQGASLQGEESALLEQDDAAWLSETLQLKLDRLVLDYVYGPGTPALAYFKVLTAQQQNVDEDIKTDEFLVRSGFPISRKQASERYSRPLPDGDTGEDLLTAPAAGPAFGAPAPSLFPAANEAGRAGREAIFLANAAAKDLAARRTVFRPIAERLAAIAAAPDATQRALLVAQLRAESPQLARAVIAQAPDLAKATEEAIGSALVSGFAESARAKKSAKP